MNDHWIALTTGFSSGCYSSIFIAGPLWMVLREAAEAKRRQAVEPKTE